MARLHQLLNSIPSLVASFDLEQRCRFANKRALKAYGLTIEQAVGTHLSDLLAPEEFSAYAAHLPLVMAGEITRFEGSAVRQGRTVSYQVNLAPEFDAERHVVGFYLMTLDISALQKAQADLQRSEARLRAITDNLPVVITYIDAEQRLQFANRTFETWTGEPASQLLGRPLRDVIGEELYAVRQEVLSEALRGERTEFDFQSCIGDTSRDLQTIYVPDVTASGDIQGVYELTTDVTRLRAAERRMAELALLDTLTELPNRRHLNQRIPDVLMRARRARTGVGVLFLDVDHFKQINDRHGHAAGDAVLLEFARRLTQCVRETDFAARFAGDEFVILLEGLHHAQEAAAVADKIVQAIRKPMRFIDQQIALSTSIGAIYLPAGTHAEPHQVLQAADEALYTTKTNGRNGKTLVIFPPPVPAA